MASVGASDSDHLEPAAATTVCYILSPANLERDLELLQLFSTHVWQSARSSIIP